MKASNLAPMKESEISHGLTYNNNNNISLLQLGLTRWQWLCYMYTKYEIGAKHEIGTKHEILRGIKEIIRHIILKSSAVIGDRNFLKWRKQIMTSEWTISCEREVRGNMYKFYGYLKVIHKNLSLFSLIIPL